MLNYATQRSRKQKAPIFREEVSCASSVNAPEPDEPPVKMNKPDFAFSRESIAEQLERIDVFETVDDVPRFTSKCKFVPNTVLLNKSLMEDGAPEGIGLSTTAQKLSIEESLLPDIRPGQKAGLGVFIRSGEIVRPGEILTEYGGDPEWITEKDLEIRSTESGYAFAFGPFHMKSGIHARGHRKYYVLLDALHSDKDNVLCCGHLINTASPVLSPPHQVANCVFGIDLSNLELDTRMTPNVRLYIVALKSVRGNSDKWDTSELLMDYHWDLAYMYGRWCNDEKCFNCVLALKDWSTKQVKYLKSHNPF